jgi:hypothetical protein
MKQAIGYNTIISNTKEKLAKVSEYKKKITGLYVTLVPVNIFESRIENGRDLFEFGFKVSASRWSYPVRAFPYALMMEAISTPDTSINFC